jgi:hypothetical protein
MGGSDEGEGVRRVGRGRIIRAANLANGKLKQDRQGKVMVV